MDSMEVKPCGGQSEVRVTYAAEKLTESISFNICLHEHEILCSRPYASKLVHEGLITEDAKNIILKGLDEIEGGAFVWRTDKEDVHMKFEAELTDLVREPYKKLHTVHCINGQVCTDFRLRCRDAVDDIVMRVKRIQLALKIEGLRLIVSGQVHLQRAQPVLPQHLFIAFVKQLAQYAGRLLDCQARMNLCPLVACALASTVMLMTSKAREYIPHMRNRANRDNTGGSNENDNEIGSNKGVDEGSGRGGNGTWITLSRVLVIGGVVGLYLLYKTGQDIRREIVGARSDWKEAGCPALVNIKIGKLEPKFNIY